MNEPQRWDRAKVHEVMDPVSATNVLKFHIPLVTIEENYIWTPSSDGLFTTK
jgi:hypothetical protein